MKLILKISMGKGLVNIFIALIGLIFNIQTLTAQQQSGKTEPGGILRQLISINENWSFLNTIQ